MVNPTSHPLVFLYSTPPCPAGGRLKVSFQSEGVAAHTPYQNCREGLSTNFYVAGMRPDSDYTLQQVTGDGEGGPVLSLRTPTVTTQTPIPSFNVTQAPPIAPREPGVLLHGIVFQAPVATDLAGNLIWYYPGLLTFMTRPVEGGRFFGLVQDLPERAADAAGAARVRPGGVHGTGDERRARQRAARRAGRPPHRFLPS